MFRYAFCWPEKEPQPCPNAYERVEQIKAFCRENSRKKEATWNALALVYDKSYALYCEKRWNDALKCLGLTFFQTCSSLSPVSCIHFASYVLTYKMYNTKGCVCVTFYFFAQNISPELWYHLIRTLKKKSSQLMYQLIDWHCYSLSRTFFFKETMPSYKAPDCKK